MAKNRRIFLFLKCLIKKIRNMNNEEKVVSNYKETLEKKIEWSFRLQSNLLTIASATFAVLVSLSNLSTNNDCSRILLLVVVCSNALSILFSCITIYENRAMSNVMIRNAQRQVEEYILYSLYNSKMTATPAVPRKKFFAACESISYTSFLLFLLI